MKKTVMALICLLIGVAVCFHASAKPVKDDISYSASLEVQGTISSEPQQQASEKKTLSQVENLAFVKSARGEVSLSWNEVAGAYGYRVFIKSDEDENYKYCTTVRSTQVTVKNIDNEGGLRFKVRAFSYDGGKAVFGKFSTPVYALTKPADVKKIYTRNIDDSSITLYWDKAKGATGYRVYIYNKSSKKYELYKRTSRTTITVGELEKDTLYTFKIMSYKRLNNSTALGDYSEEYKEYTYNSGSQPHTKSQAAQCYNSYISQLKTQQNMKVKYKKSIDTQFMSCSKNNLAASVKNTLNMFEGTLSKTYTYVDGESGAKSANKLIEPYGKKPSLERDDILKYSVTEKQGNIYLIITLKNENNIYKKGNKNQQSYFDGVLSLPDYKSLKTSPLTIENADSYYSGGTLTLKITDGAVSALKINAAVLSDIGFSVADIKASTIIGYEVKEQYTITYQNESQ